MKNNPEFFNSTQRVSSAQVIFVDPIRKPLIGSAFALVFAALVPVWPIDGDWWGVPAWAVFALFMSILLSMLTAYVILKIWYDPEDALTEHNEGCD